MNHAVLLEMACFRENETEETTRKRNTQKMKSFGYEVE